MNVTITNEALARLPEGGILKIAYDAEGCGCIVCGVTRLWLVDGPAVDDRRAECAAYPVLYDTRHAVFYEEALKVDYIPARRAFTIASSSQIYNHDADLVDLRSSNPTISGGVR